MEKKRTIATGAGPVEVRKLALYDYAEFIRSLRKLPKGFAEFFQSGKDVKDMAVIFDELPILIADSWDDFVAVLAVGTDKDIEFFKSPDLDGADALDIIQALLELNDYQRIIATVKKIMARKPQTETETPDPVNKAEKSQT